MQKYYVYMLRCNDGSLYCGYTPDPQKRLILHNKGTASRYTRARLPVKMVFLMEFESKSEALKTEHTIKKLTKQEKEALVTENPFSVLN